MLRYFLVISFYLLGGITWSLIEVFDPPCGYSVYKFFMITSGDLDIESKFWEEC